ncbi:linear amide C-N hydrolase [Jeotgalibaca sp. MA1X17-3]|uniref:linear amide C-N hydrolase n=1 Tax=Jeotgalibaca sp. MA1X17-3 TaxID=2908211 RepID=UPI001F3266CF|nr:linear amide C-N hydrolase [Jeotgalibaca sp. MA1X17-3]UJF15841.1 linear amide C-N hydrolase [Jeotgalibaca sp. MA1X17-3]
MKVGIDTMCTTVGFAYQEGFVFGRTLELGMKLDNNILFVPKNKKDYIQSRNGTFASKYACIGTGFFNIPSFGDGINEKGLVASSNFLPGYATFAKEPVEGKINLITSDAFDYLLTRCKNISEVREEAKKLVLLEHGDTEKDVSTSNHFFFMDSEGNKVVLEPKDGILMAYDNPYGVLTNAPEFPWHATNLKNYLHLKPENVEETIFNEATVSKLGEGSGMVGLPGDFTPPSRFVRSAYFVSNTPKDLKRGAAILQAFRILSQANIPTGAIVDPVGGHCDETLYTSVMDTNKQAYYIKCHDNINLQSFYLDDYKNNNEITFIPLEKEMNL